MREALRQSAESAQQSRHFEEVQGSELAQLSVRDLRASIENAYTREVNWSINGFRNKLAQRVKMQMDHSDLSMAVQEPLTFQSPKFAICGLNDFSLELVPPLERTDALNHADLPLCGSAALRVWAPPGLFLCFLLSMGEGPAQVTRTFEHEFRQQQDEALCCFHAPNFCQLTQVWNPPDAQSQNDSLVVSLAVLEFRRALSPTRVASASEGLVAGVERGSLPDEVLPVARCTSETVILERIKQELQTLRNRSVPAWSGASPGSPGCSRPAA